MIKSTKSIKSWRLIIGCSLLTIAVLSYIFFPVLSPERSQKLYKEAQRKCGNEIWLVIEDIGPIVTQQKAPFPEQYKGELIINYGCSQAEADKVALDNSRWSWLSLAFLIAIPITVFIGVILILAWFIPFAFKKLRQKALHQKS